jgi:hypothetical protein
MGEERHAGNKVAGTHGHNVHVSCGLISVHTLPGGIETVRLQLRRVVVRMKNKCWLAIGLPDVLPRCSLGDPKDGIIVLTHGIGSQSNQ